MNGIKNHQIANRSRRIPRRIRQLKVLINAAQARIDEVENDENLNGEVKQARIRDIRNQVGPAHAQIRALVERGNQLGVVPSLLIA